MDDKEAFMQLERVGREHLEKWCDEQQCFDALDAFEAFKDLEKYGFYRNRKDELADEYIKYAQGAISEVAQDLVKPEDKVRFLATKGSNVVDIFKNKVSLKYPHSKAKGIHPIDIQFLRSVCNDFIPQLEGFDFNVRKLCQWYFKKGDLESLHKLIDSIKGVGSKIASLYVRDMRMLYEKLPDAKHLSDRLTHKEMLLVYPIDTWVRKISKQLTLDTEDMNKVEIQIMDKCDKFGVSALFVNNGIWYLGSNSLDFIFDNLDKIEMLKVCKS